MGICIWVFCHIQILVKFSSLPPGTPCLRCLLPVPSQLFIPFQEAGKEEWLGFMFLQSLPSLASAVFVDKFSLFYDTVTRAGLRSPLCYLESFNYPAGGCWPPVTGYLCATRVKVRPPWRNSGGNLSSKNPISRYTACSVYYMPIVCTR